MSEGAPRGVPQTILRAVALFLVCTLIGWLAYVWIVSTLVGKRLRILAATRGANIEYVEVRSWYPGQLVLSDLVMGHSLLEAECRTRAAKVALPHHPLSLFAGQLRVRRLVSEQVETVCNRAQPGAARNSAGQERPGSRQTTIHATLHAEFVWRRSGLGPGSGLELTVAPFTWNHDSGADTQLDGTSTLHARVLQGGAANENDQNRVECRIDVPSVRHRGPGSTTVSARSLAVLVEGRASSRLDMLRPAHLEAQAKAVELRRRDLLLAAGSSSVEGRFVGPTHDGSLRDDALFARLQVRLDQVQLEGLEGSKQQVGGESSEPPTFSATADLRARPVSSGYQGTFHGEGEDAGVVLALVRGHDLPSWVVSKFHGEPFELSAALELDRDAVRLENLELRRGALHVEGWWHSGRHRSGGALLMRYGGLAVGLDSREPGSVVLRPGPGWLQSTSPP